MSVWHHILPPGKMGLSISYPPDDYLPAVEDDMGRLFIRSLSFDDMEAAADSPSYSPSALPPAFGSGKLIMEGSLGFFERREADSVQMQNVLSIRNPKPPDREACSSVSPGAATATCGSSRFDRPPDYDYPMVGMNSPRHQSAAVRLQKVYKSFRTRRQLADCAVLVEQRW